MPSFRATYTFVNWFFTNRTYFHNLLYHVVMILIPGQSGSLPSRGFRDAASYRG